MIIRADMVRAVPVGDLADLDLVGVMAVRVVPVVLTGVPADLVVQADLVVPADLALVQYIHCIRARSFLSTRSHFLVQYIRCIRARSFLSIRSHFLVQYIRCIRARSLLSIRCRSLAHIHASPHPATHVLFLMVRVRIRKDRIQILRLGASAPGRFFDSRIKSIPETIGRGARIRRKGITRAQ
jgi:hypothetical protein